MIFKYQGWCYQRGALSLVEIRRDTELSLVEIFMMLPQLSYAIKTQLTQNPPRSRIYCLIMSFWHNISSSVPALSTYHVVSLCESLSSAVSPPLCCQAGACSPPACCPSGSSTLDICGCCHVCAGAEGEACGGPWDAQGSCGAGLRCFRQCGGLRQHYYHDAA